MRDGEGKNGKLTWKKYIFFSYVFFWGVCVLFSVFIICHSSSTSSSSSLPSSFEATMWTMTLLGLISAACSVGAVFDAAADDATSPAAAAASEDDIAGMGILMVEVDKEDRVSAWVWRM